MEHTEPQSNDIPDLKLPEKYTFWDSINKSLFFDAPAGFVGQGALWFTATAPNGWLICDGSSLLRSDYPRLFAVIGTTYGAADGTHFTLPDLRGRVPIGVGTGSGLTARSLAGTGGEENHLLTSSESGVPAHTHPINESNYNGTGNQVAVGQNPTAYSNNANTSNNVPANAANSHNNMQPWLAINFIIKF